MIRINNQQHSECIDVLDDSESLVVVFDINDKIIGFNSKCEQMTGYTFAEVKGHSIQDMLLINGESHYGGRYYISGNENKAPEKYITSWKARNGEHLEITWSNQLLRDGAHKATHIVATSTSVTKKREKHVQQVENAEQQEIINNLLFIAMEDTTITDKLNQCMRAVKTSSWMPQDTQLEIYILRDINNKTELFTQEEIETTVQVKQDDLEYRHKICDESINSGRSHFSTNSINNVSKHARYYGIPIKSAETILAVLVVHLNNVHTQDLREMFFLRTAANVFTIIIERYKTQSALPQSQTEPLTTQKPHIGNWQWNTKNNTLNCSNEVKSIFGINTKNTFFNVQDYLRRVKPEDTSKVLKSLQHAIKNNDHLKLQHRIMTPSGEQRTVKIHAIAVRNKKGHLVSANGTIEDITHSLKTEENTQLVTHIFKNVQESIIVCNIEKKIIKVNQMFTTNTGYLENEVIGKSLLTLCSETQDDKTHSTIWSEINTKGKWTGEIWTTCKNGEIYPEWRTITSILDDKGKISHYVAISTNITDKKHSEECIHQLAHYDSLTKLPNKKLFNTLLSNELKTSSTSMKKIAVLFLNLDGVKRINDSMGHQVGDNLLTIIAHRLNNVMRANDIVSRWGSDEFVIMLPNIEQQEDVVTLIKNINQCIIEPVSIVHEKQVSVCASIGASIFPDDCHNATSLVQNAAMAMHKVKNDGGNGFQFYTTQINIDAIERLGIETGLRHAIEFNQFEVYYQPIIDIKSQTITGAEALIRWNHPTKGLIPPDMFIPIAEDSQLIIPIGEWVLKQACEECKRWQSNDLTSLKISVNLSAIQFRDKNLPAVVNTALQESGLKPSLLTLELTESAIMDNINQTIKSLHLLKDIGVSLSIDDFGTGYSSLAYLKRFPINKLKIDKSFMLEVDKNKDDASIVQSIIALGNSLNLNIIAEGVEKSSHMSLLNSLDCKEAQGYYISKPLPAEKFSEFVQQWKNKNRTNNQVVSRHAHAN